MYLEHDNHAVLRLNDDGQVKLDLEHGDPFVDDNVANVRAVDETRDDAAAKVDSLDLDADVTD